MNVYVRPDAHLSQAMVRVAKALEFYAPPGVTVVPDRELADLEVLHVIGYPETVARFEANAGVRRTAMIQYCLTTTQEPDPKTWLPFWDAATAVWSYYDLAPRCRTLYYAPLGVDTRVFRPHPHLGKPFRLGMSGYVAESECLEECTQALVMNGSMGFHLGPSTLNLGKHVISHLGMTDDILSQFWSMCHYVAGLRREEGFELPVYEGLACGARPIVFDAPHYRHWLGDHACYLTETDDPVRLIEDLRQVLSTDPVLVTSDERDWLRETFHWKTLAQGFWERAL